MGQLKAEELAAAEAAKMAPGQKYVRGLYTGGTLCDEAMKLMIASLGHIYSNIPLKPEDRLADARGGEAGSTPSWTSGTMRLPWDGRTP